MNGAAAGLHRNREGGLSAGDGAVQSVAFNGFTSGFAYQANQFFAAHSLRRGGTGVVINLLLNDRAVDIVNSETQGYLCNFGGKHLPVGLDMGKIIEHQAADGEVLDVQETGGSGQVLQRSVVWMEGERNERLESAGFILQGSEFHQVVDPVFVIFNVAIEHGRIRPQTQPVGNARRFQPLGAINLVVAYDAAYAVRKNFCTATRQRINP